MLGTPIVDRGSRYSGSFVGQNPASGSSGSDSDSGNSIFITQHPVRPRRQRRSGLKTPNGNENDKKKERRVKLPAFTFYHVQGGKPTRLELNKSQNIHYHNALMGGFFYSVRELQACETTDLLSSLPTVDQEGDFIAPVSKQDELLEEEDIKVKKKDLVVFSKTKRPQPWYNPPRANRQSGAATPCRDRLGGASHSGSRNGTSPGNRQTGKNPSRIQAEASETKENRVFQQEETRDESASDSDATFCEFPEKDAQNAGGESTGGESTGGESTGGAELQVDEQEEPEAQGDDSQSQKKKSKDLNVTLEPTEQVDESGSCLETTDKRTKKKKKKKKRHRSEGEETSIEGSFSNDDISSPASQKLKKSFDGPTAEGAEDKATQLMSQKKKRKRRKKKRWLSLSLCCDTVPESDDSESVKKQTSSFPAADAGTSASESAEIGKRHEVGKKKKKRKLEAAIGDGKLNETLQKSEAKRKRKEKSAVTLAGVCGPDADAGYNQNGEDGVVVKKKKKKKKKKKDTEAVPPAASQPIQSVLVPCSSLPHEKTGLSVDGHDASPSTHTNNTPEKRRKRKSDNPRKFDPNSIDSEIEATEEEGTEVTAGFSEIPATLQTASYNVSKRKNKRTLHNPSEDFLTDW